MDRRVGRFAEPVVLPLLIGALTLGGCSTVHENVPWGLTVAETPTGAVEQDAVAVDWTTDAAGLTTLRATHQVGTGVRFLEVRGTMTQRKGMAGQAAYAGTVVFLTFSAAGAQGVSGGGGSGGDAAIALLVILLAPATVGLALAIPAWTYALLSLPFYALWSGDRWYGVDGERVSVDALRDWALEQAAPGFVPTASPRLWVDLPPVAVDAELDDAARAEPEWEADE